MQVTLVSLQCHGSSSKDKNISQSFHGGFKERVKIGEYDRNIMYSYMQMKKETVETILRREGIKQYNGGDEFNLDILQALL